jgi:hypothetical protein
LIKTNQTFINQKIKRFQMPKAYLITNQTYIPLS